MLNEVLPDPLTSFAPSSVYLVVILPPSGRPPPTPLHLRWHSEESRASRACGGVFLAVLAKTAKRPKIISGRAAAFRGGAFSGRGFWIVFF